jgi:ATP-dependent helicase/nuclease subunit B
MLITFGMDLDGSPWSHEPAALGTVQLGPEGLLSVLETRLGLGGPPIHPARRIDQYLARLEASDEPGEWFHGSLEADPWSTARHLLAWRDELVEAGWDGKAGSEASPRLAGLAQVEEKVELPLAPGRADRLQRVLEHLSRGRAPGVDRVRLLDPASLLPPTWRTLLRRMEALGTEVEAEAPPDPASDPETHLARIRSRLGSGGAGPFVPSPDDESLLLLSAATEWDAAETAALWLECELERREAAGEGEGIPAEVAIVCGRDTHLLDQALARRGLPTLERSSPSPWRDTLQLLPLVLANVWRPVDVGLLAQLLTHEGTSVPRRAARKLMRALIEEPGVGGPAWTRALEAVETAEWARLAEEGAEHPARDAARLRAELDRRLAAERFSPSEGVPAGVVADRCEWVRAGLGPRAGSDPLAAAAIAHATELSALARRRQAEGATLPRVTLERILDSLVGTGEKAPDRIPRAAPWTVVRSPAQITRPVDTILWWGFTHEAAAPATWWTDLELRALQQAGVELERPALRRELEARSR